MNKSAGVSQVLDYAFHKTVVQPQHPGDFRFGPVVLGVKPANIIGLRLGKPCARVVFPTLYSPVTYSIPQVVRPGVPAEV